MPKTSRAFLLIVALALAFSPVLGAVQQADPPKAKSFFVVGEVKQPGEKLWDETMTVGGAIDLAGGMTTRGSLDRSYIQRKKDNGSIETIKGLKVETQILASDTLVIARRLF